MDEKLLERARETAKLPYSVTIIQDEATDGTPILLVENDELKGCMAQGKNMQEAIANLEEARVDYLYSLLEDKQDIPLPEQTLTVTVGSSTFEETVTATTQQSDYLDDAEHGTENESGPSPVRVVLQT